MNKEALLRVADIVESVPEAEFDIRCWKAGAGCGTVRCAIGSAAVDPWFVEQGFTLTSHPIGPYPRWRGWEDWEAVCRFFSLTLAQAEHMFSTYSYTGPVTTEEVATRIRQFVASEGASFDDK